MDGDLYLDTQSGIIWVWSQDTESWSIYVELMGPTGPQGAPGAKGNQGAQGAKGSKGNTGAQGAQGAKGNQGAQGAPGTPGTAGPTGPAGASGSLNFWYEWTTSSNPGGTYLGTNNDKIGAGVTSIVMNYNSRTTKNSGTTNRKSVLEQVGVGSQIYIAEVGSLNPGNAEYTVTSITERTNDIIFNVSLNAGGGEVTSTPATNNDIQVEISVVPHPGADGSNGATGAQGAQGAKGNTGAQGAKGNPGAKGATGAKGSKGNTGAQGAPGPGSNYSGGATGTYQFETIQGQITFVLDNGAVTSINTGGGGR